MIDFDPQADLTSSLGFKNADGMEHTIKTLMEKIITKQPIDKKEAIITNEENIDLVPSNIELEALEASMINFENRENILRNYISKVKDDYDFIIIDCPPSLGLMTLNALVASDSIIIPIQAEFYALEGLSQLVKTVQVVSRRMNPRLHILGILLTMFDGRTNLSLQVAEEVKKYFGSKVFRTVIPRTVKLSEAPSFGEPVLTYAPKSKGAEAYKKLSREVLKRE